MRKFFSVILLVFFCSFAWQLGNQSGGNPMDPMLEKKSPCTPEKELSTEVNRNPSAYRLNSNISPKTLN
ncbi:hypothetical protein SAMN04487988_106157 [Algoriphagus hitonicola]|uniref:Uncharacterized protein n=1 Tax=Algoriphagus hitonicola TaxID=435880 RepID=A0A1I2TQH0_9BACT|nr:hypothetical protein SAMN04487988_106157 [Algoriphagus hitonicola]